MNTPPQDDEMARLTENVLALKFGSYLLEKDGNNVAAKTLNRIVDEMIESHQRMARI